MTTNITDFSVNDLYVNDSISIDSDLVLNNIPFSINNQTNRLQAFINDKWVDLALLSDTGVTVINNSMPGLNYEGGMP